MFSSTASRPPLSSPDRRRSCKPALAAVVALLLAVIGAGCTPPLHQYRPGALEPGTGSHGSKMKLRILQDASPVEVFGPGSGTVITDLFLPAWNNTESSVFSEGGNAGFTVTGRKLPA